MPASGGQEMRGGTDSSGTDCRADESKCVRCLVSGIGVWVLWGYTITNSCTHACTDTHTSSAK